MFEYILPHDVDVIGFLGVLAETWVAVGGCSMYPRQWRLIFQTPCLVRLLQYRVNLHYMHYADMVQ